MENKKIYRVRKYGNRMHQDRVVSGTLEELCQYWEVEAKSIASLVSKVQNNYERKEAACYERTSVELLKDTDQTFHGLQNRTPKESSPITNTV